MRHNINNINNKNNICEHLILDIHRKSIYCIGGSLKVKIALYFLVIFQNKFH